MAMRTSEGGLTVEFKGTGVSQLEGFYQNT